MRLSRPIGEMEGHYDAVVVGSGYGGGVAAARLARMGYRVAVLERGLEIAPGEFPDTPAKSLRQFQASTQAGHLGDETALFDLHAGEDINVLVGCGLGGTSLINANVSLRADPRVFDDPLWPAGLDDADLAAGYRAAEEMLRPIPYPNGEDGWPRLNKLEALKQSGARLGTETTRPPINVAFTAGENAAGIHQPACNLCGDCCSGCNTGAKTTVAMSYLPDAVRFGAGIFCGVSVRHVARSGDAWRIAYLLPERGRDLFEAPEGSVSADIVVLAAGTLGSTGILLRSRDRGLSLSPALGTRFSGNGDVLAFGYNNDVAIDGVGMGEDAADYSPNADERRPVGPTITGLVDLRGSDDVEDGMVIEEGAIPGGLARYLPPVLCASARAFGTDTDRGDWTAERRRELQSLLRGARHGAVNHTQTFLVMSHDGADGTLALQDDRISVHWPDVGHKPVFQRVAENLTQAAAANGGTFLPNPVWSELMDRHLVTVHPLGGCPMGTDAAGAVVDEACRVFAGASGNAVHDGLYVCDGAVMPRSVGVNPLLTITAVAERAMIRLARDRGRDIRQGPPATPVQPRPAGKVGIRFTEKMVGEVTLVASGETGPASFVATVEADDADRFIREESHEAAIYGTVSVPALSPRALSISGGRFNLFTKAPERVETREMVYRLPLAADDGRRFFFEGHKTIHDDPGFDLWGDTTTLAVKIHEGSDASGELVAEGRLVIDPADFIRQMRTMEAPGARDLREKLSVIGRFGHFFAGRLFTTFGGPFVRPSLFDPDAVRQRRTLRVGEPELHRVTTADGLTLRLTRYRGGSKGPVMFSHGLGVSSLIFAIDTIQTNLLEYVFAAGYDCWLLDHRASIELPYPREQYDADQVAAQDYAPAIEVIRAVTGSNDVQVIAHCYGAMTFAMAMLDGLAGIRSAVISQIAAHAQVPFFPQRMLAFLRAPDAMRLVGMDRLDARATIHRDLMEKVIDGALAFYPYNPGDRSRSATSRRISAIYGQLYELDQLNQATLDALPEMFGEACIAAYLHLGHIARAGHIVRADGTDSYLADTNLRRFNVPTLFVHGEKNRAFLPDGTEETRSVLAAANGAHLYERVVIPATGHIDCIFGKNAAETVYPHILRHLEMT
jgi:cholesterol oxidase